MLVGGKKSILNCAFGVRLLPEVGKLLGKETVAAGQDFPECLTADRVLINADTAVHPELLSCRFAYVSVSRARLDAEIYTNNAAELAPRLSANVGKSTALDVSQTAGISTDLGIGQSI